MKNQNSPLTTFVTLSLMTSIVLISTMFLKLPTLTGYVHLGDGVIYSVSLAFGGFHGAVSGALGSFLADVFGGYAFWSPWTFIIKGVAGYLVAKLGYGKTKLLQLVAMGLASLWIVAGYAIGTAVIYSPEAVPVEVLGNLVQTGSGVLIGTVLTPVLRSIPLHHNHKH